MSGDCCGSEKSHKGKGHHKKGHHKKGHGKKGCNCGCGCHSWRNFRTKQEMIDELEDYKSELEKELKAVEERIEELK